MRRTPRAIARPRSSGYFKAGLWQQPLAGGASYDVTSHSYPGTWRPQRSGSLPHRVVYGFGHDIDDSVSIPQVLAVARFHADHGVRRFGIEARQADVDMGTSPYFSQLTRALRAQQYSVVFLFPNTPESQRNSDQGTGASLALDLFGLRDFRPIPTKEKLRTVYREKFGARAMAILEGSRADSAFEQAFRQASRHGVENTAEAFHHFRCNIWQLYLMRECHFDLAGLATKLSQFVACDNALMGETIRTSDVQVSFVGLAYMVPVATAGEADSCNMVRHRIAADGHMEPQPIDRTQLGPLTATAAREMDHQWDSRAFDTTHGALSRLSHLRDRHFEDCITEDPLFFDRAYYALIAIGSEILQLPLPDRKIVGVPGLHFLHLAPTTAEQEWAKVVNTIQHLR
ncbi:MAG: hypothetical protein HYV02_08500 [Deltaproteobacteria bacterium]|nr:hypothetical protein [Deltaproteobacteria bacterium]